MSDLAAQCVKQAGGMEKGEEGGVDGREDSLDPLNRLKSNLKLITTFIILVLLLFSMYIFRDYVHAVLLWMELEPPWVIVVMFTALFTLVSLPLAWGYIVINMAAGYLFGVMYGLLVTVVTATVGILIAHFIIKLFFTGYVNRILNGSDYIRALYSVISGPQAFRIVALARLTPVPFGLQNAVFSITNLPTTRYLLASGLGLLPSQTINAYIGSTLRSMEEVLTNVETVRTGWILLAVQLCISVLLGVLVIRRARAELDKSIEAQTEADIESGTGKIIDYRS